MQNTKLLRTMSALVLTTLAVPGCIGTEPTDETELSSDTAPLFGVDSVSLFTVAADARIAVVGAGPAGLTAARTLKDKGYDNVVVFERDSDVGGKVRSFDQPPLQAELGAVLASHDYEIVLEFAEQYGIPTARLDSPLNILDETGQPLTIQEFLLSRYSLGEILLASAAYALALELFQGLEQSGFAFTHPDLRMPFDQFAEKYRFTPLAEAARALMVGFGYSYYEDVPAMYYMKLMPWLVKVGPLGPEPAEYLTFPTGFQSVWRAVASELDVRLNSEVTAIERTWRWFGGWNVKVTVNGKQAQDFDYVIIAAPLNVVPRFLDATEQELALFAQVQTNRYIVSLFSATGLSEGSLFIYDHARPEMIDHAAVWSSLQKPEAYIGYQTVRDDATDDEVINTLAQDVADNGGELTDLLLRQEWDYFPRVNTEALNQNFYERLELRQGLRRTFYVGSTLSFETVEHSARYARDRINEFFDDHN